MSGDSEPVDAPVLITVVKGNPSPEEIAALVLVLAGSISGAAPRPSRGANQWSAYWRSLRTPIMPGPGSWRQSGRP